MSLPANIRSIRIYPAVGFARLSTSDAHYVHGSNPATLKSNGVIKRQAVQYRIFAFDQNRVAVEELTPGRLQQLGIKAVWEARVANRKIARNRGPQFSPSYVIEALASSDNNGGKLTGRCANFAEGQNIPLGEIGPDGLFLPPKAGIFREDANVPLPNTAGLRSGTVADNTCDGEISVALSDAASGVPINIPLLTAWVVVTPPDFAPDWDDVSGRNLYNYLVDNIDHLAVGTPPLSPLNQTAHDLTKTALFQGTADFNPGIEIYRPESVYFQDPTLVGDPAEIRLRPKTNVAGQGVDPGELSMSLCSPWQFDFLLCTCSFWVNQRPDTAFRESDTGNEVEWLRKTAAEDGTPPPSGLEIDTIPTLVDHVFELGIIRKQNNKRVEKERTADIP
ncbi:MAG TPA: LodA/GoxA family CTQ-dependent oxidase [Chthoniobacter sp.]|nr:LodA/GoxA family CTQ-dependent oxidase [Chthoniobacter sp.]